LILIDAISLLITASVLHAQNYYICDKTHIAATSKSYRNNAKCFNLVCSNSIQCCTANDFYKLKLLLYW